MSANPQLTRDVEKVWRYYRAFHGKRYRLTPERRALIRRRLKDWPAKDLCRAIIGCQKSDWHMGANDRDRKYNSIELILRNAEKIEGFLERYEDWKTKRRSMPRSRTKNGNSYEDTTQLIPKLRDQLESAGISTKRFDDRVLVSLQHAARGWARGERPTLDRPYRRVVRWLAENAIGAADGSK